MRKLKRNMIIAVSAIALVAITSGIAVTHQYGGIDNIALMFGGLFDADKDAPGNDNGTLSEETLRGDVSGKYTLTDPLSQYYDETRTGLDISKQGLVLEVIDAEITKEIGDMSLSYLKEEGGYLPDKVVEFDEAYNLTGDISYLKVTIQVKNVYPKIAACFLNNITAFGTTDELEKLQRSDLRMALCFRTKLATMTGENELDDNSQFFIRIFEPGETREFTVGYLVQDADLKKENKFFYEVSPTCMSDFYLEGEGYPVSGDTSFVEDLGLEESDNDFRYIYLNRFIEEKLK